MAVPEVLGRSFPDRRGTTKDDSMVWSAGLGERFQAVWCLGEPLPGVPLLEAVLYHQGDPAAFGHWCQIHPDTLPEVWAIASRGLALQHFGCWSQLLQDLRHWSAVLAPYGGLPPGLAIWLGSLTDALAQERLRPWCDPRHLAIGAPPWQRAIAHAWTYGDQPQLALGWDHGPFPGDAPLVQLLIAAAYGILPSTIAPRFQERQSMAQGFWDRWVGGHRVPAQAVILPPLDLPYPPLISQGEYAWPNDFALGVG